MSRKKLKARTKTPEMAREPEAVPAAPVGSVRVGDSVLRQPVTFTDSVTDSKVARVMRGTVVYVHPKGRFHVVEFSRGIRESFMGVQR